MTTFAYLAKGDKIRGERQDFAMNKPVPFSARIPVSIQTRIAEVSNLLGYSQNRVAVEILDMGLNMIYRLDYGGFPRILNIARAILAEERIHKVTGLKSPLENGPALWNLDSLTPSVKTKLQQSALNGCQIRALHHLSSSQRITRHEYEAVAQTPGSTAKRHLSNLVESGILVKRGKSRNSWYEFASEAKKSSSRK